MKTILKRRKAQSLLETIIAIGILIVGVVSMVSLMNVMLVARTTAEYETVATNLAREGIEVVRNLRDTNWINNLPFDQGLFASSRYCASFDPSNSDGSHATGWRLAPAVLDPTLAVVKYSAGPYVGFYTQVGTGETAHWTVAPTIFTRTLVITDICANGTIMGAGTACPVGTSAGIRTTSVVNWNERGRPHSVTLEERIYDWR